MNAEWRWDFALEILPQMLMATLNTIMAAVIGYAIAAIVGLLFLLGLIKITIQQLQQLHSQLQQPLLYLKLPLTFVAISLMQNPISILHSC